MKIVITASIPWFEPAITELQMKYRDIEFVSPKIESEIDREIKTAEAAVVINWNQKLHRMAKNIKWLQFLTGGINNSLFYDFINSSISATSLKPLFATAGAEFGLAAMLMFSRRLNYIKRQHLSNPPLDMWPQVPEPEDLSGKTVGIIGFGYMGKELARKASSLGLNVLATARTRPLEYEWITKFYPLDNLHDLLKLSDYVIVAVPETEKTINLVNKSFLKRMKSNSFLIDISGRGSIYNFNDLVTSITEQEIAGVCLQTPLDSADSSIPKSSSEFWTRENVVLSPKRITSVDMEDQIREFYKENVDRFVKNMPLLGLVNKQEGY
jgi:phosphoglycerate dehydrogenase-like enzyme